MRTEQDAPTVATNGKWRANFVTYNGTPGDEYVANTCGSAPVFNTEDEAYAGGSRALDILEQTGKFPNMCDPF
jgi:hypothetical protein